MLGDSDSNRDCKAPKACGLPITPSPIAGPAQPTDDRLTADSAPWLTAERFGHQQMRGRPPRARLPGWLRRRKLRWRNSNVRGDRP